MLPSQEIAHVENCTPDPAQVVKLSAVTTGGGGRVEWRGRLVDRAGGSDAQWRNLLACSARGTPCGCAGKELAQAATTGGAGSVSMHSASRACCVCAFSAFGNHLVRASLAAQRGGRRGGLVYSLLH